MGTSSTHPDVPMVELRDVVRTFRPPGRKQRGAEPIVALAVDRLVVARGQCLVVHGANGAGKTTLLHLVAGLLRPDEGTVAVAGTDLDDLSEARLDRFRSRTIGYLLQGAPLLEGLSAEENLLAAMLFAGRRSGARARTHALLELVGMAHRARHRPRELSGGERQKVALARALVADPPLLLADEPLASLDPGAAEDIAGLLDRQVTEAGRTLVVVAHDVGPLTSMSQRLVLGANAGEAT